MESKCSTSLGQCSTGEDFFRSVERFENLEVQVSKPYEVKGLKVEIFLEQREVAFLSPSKIYENLNFFYCTPLKIQIFSNFDR